MAAKSEDYTTASGSSCFFLLVRGAGFLLAVSLAAAAIKCRFSASSGMHRGLLGAVNLLSLWGGGGACRSGTLWEGLLLPCRCMLHLFRAKPPVCGQLQSADSSSLPTSKNCGF